MSFRLLYTSYACNTSDLKFSSGHARGEHKINHRSLRTRNEKKIQKKKRNMRKEEEKKKKIRREESATGDAINSTCLIPRVVSKVNSWDSLWLQFAFDFFWILSGDFVKLQ